MATMLLMVCQLLLLLLLRRLVLNTDLQRYLHYPLLLLPPSGLAPAAAIAAAAHTAAGSSTRHQGRRSPGPLHAQVQQLALHLLCLMCSFSPSKCLGL
jgi:hypothetical protein